MVFMQQLKTAKKQRVDAVDVVTKRRNNVIDNLVEQKAVLQCDLSGEEYTVQKYVWVADDEGNKQRVQRNKHIRRWYWQQDGEWLLQLRYGVKQLDLGKGTNTVVAKTGEQLAQDIDSCVKAVEAGELDKAIELVATR